MIEPRELLTRLFRAGVAAADPRVATRQAVVALPDLITSVIVISAGKGAHAMASGAVEALAARGVGVAAGLVVAHHDARDSTHGLESVIGDHPVAGERSLAAADRLQVVASRASPAEDAIVLISGGATSLIAAPVDGLSARDLEGTFSALLSSGADITVMNAIRKRLLRFGAGRLALALPSRRIHCLIASDVVSNDLASIASGPCVADTSTAGEAKARAVGAGAWESLPGTARSLIEGMAEGRIPDSAPVDHPRFATTNVRIILDRHIAAAGAASAANDAGLAVEVVDQPVEGEAADAGTRLAQQIVRRPREAKPACLIWSGETTVTMDVPGGKGGRCQELVLAAARVLANSGEDGHGITLLAAGTDGRDGANDSAGGVVDWSTWSAIERRGINPELALRRHTSYDALDSVGALIRTGATGTNVNDLVMALVS
jgi:glycerate 2-kinase